MRSSSLLLVLALSTVIVAHASDARADIMTTCTSEISRYCADVSEGQGRIFACLVGQRSQLSSACVADVQAEEQNPQTSASVRKFFDPAFGAPLPQACAAPAAELCPGMTPGEGRVFACLYARSDRVSKDCSDAVQANAGVGIGVAGRHSS